MYTDTKISKWSRKTSFTTRCKVDGALQRPKGVRTHSNAPNCVLKAVFFDIFVMDSNQMEPTDKVYLRKDSGTPQCTQYGLDRRQRIWFLYSWGIPRLVVNAHTPFTIRFSHQQATHCIWTSGWSNSARSMQLVQLSLKLIQLAQVHFVRVYPR